MLSQRSGELLVDYTSPQSAQVTEVRGSLIASSLQTLRDRGLFERYLPKLPEVHREQVLFCLAASWLPLDVAMAHYAACEAMQLTDAELEALGNDVSKRIMGTFLATLVRSARHVAVGTSIPLKQYPRLWERLMIGGSCKVTMFGAKDARIESFGVPMFRYRYFRTAYTGLVRGASLMFRSAAHTRVRRAGDDTLSVDISWV
jgi:hypothetical protein